ncbi:MAG: stage II sporulation protein P [Lachnospiraceae bacterium]|nr:stage II sporulation protein P [Lachnospiraceae bacterium]MDE7059167.1 stage II sporulation protein P [Lachnospiraceae bacterium]
MQRVCQREFARCLYPGLFLEYEEDSEPDSLADWYIQRVLTMHPLYKLQHGAEQLTAMENAATYEMLISGGVHDENEVDENGQEYDMEALAQQENEKVIEQKTEEEQQKVEEAMAEEENKEVAEKTETTVSEATPAGTIYNLEELSDFEYLFGNFYTMDKTTTISPQDLNAEVLLSKDMSIDKEVDGPQILIYHTHSQEGFVDSVPGDNSTTIVGVGAYLAQLLEEKGYQVMHVTSVYDLVDGKLDRNEAYSKASEEISAILAENPSIQSVIDLHRDGVKEGTHLVTEINGKPTARFMFFNGLSRTKKNGAIDYLYNPYIEDNLALTLQLKLMSEQYYPGLARNIYLRSLRYNLHLSDKALLIEAGAQTNTLEEMMNTMEPLADILDKVFDS